MPDYFYKFLQILKALDKYKVDYILIGGVAVILHGLERLTRDIDLFVKNEVKNIERLRQALSSVFKDASIEEITLEELQKYPVIRYGTPSSFYIDIMMKLGEKITFDNLEYEIIEHQGVRIKIATPETLVYLKNETLRDKDKIDAFYLKELLKARNANKGE